MKRFLSQRKIKIIFSIIIYSFLVGLSFITLMGSRGVEPSIINFSIENFLRILRLSIEVVFPFHPHFVGWLTNPNFQNIPAFWAGKPGNTPFLDWHFLVLIIFTFLFWLDRKNIFTYKNLKNSLPIFGFLAFMYIYPTAQSQRHLGMLFVVIVASVWMRKNFSPKDIPTWWISLLVISSLSGILTVPFDYRNFSNGKYAANWLSNNASESDYVIASPEYAAQPIIAYLKRPIYFAECTCKASSIKSLTSPYRRIEGNEDFLKRINKIMTIKNYAFIVVNKSFDDKSISFFKENGLNIEFKKSFEGAEVWDENFFIYTFLKT